MGAPARAGRAARRILHPALFGAAPLLLLFAHNRHQVELRELWAPLALAAAGVTISWLAARRLAGPGRGALIASATAVAFFSFGHLRQLGELAFRFRFGAYEDTLLALALAVAMVWLGFRLGRAGEPAASVHLALDRAGLALVGSSALMITFSALRSPEPSPAGPEPRLADRASADAPDIYYLVLDGYGRSDVLRDSFGYDDGPLLRTLAEQGFFVAGRAHANYGQTLFSLASTLDLDYLHELAEQLGPGEQDRGPVVERLRGSFLLRYLREKGYRIVAFETGYRHTELRDADRYLAPPPGLSEFEVAALDLTPLGILARRRKALDGFELHRRRIRFTLHELPRLAREPGPKFVFAHVVCPHPPFVFRADGSAAASGRGFRMQDGSHYLSTSTREAYVEGYRGQIAFLSGQVEQALRELLAASPRPPVVIVQGDHGPGSRLDHDSLEHTDLLERMSILSAIHLPGPPEPALHPALSPVNTFRIVLNHSFGERFPLLADRSYFATWESPYAFRDVTAALAAAEARAAALRSGLAQEP